MDHPRDHLAQPSVTEDAVVNVQEEPAGARSTGLAPPQPVAGEVRTIPLSEIDLDDKTYCFRMVLSDSTLTRSIEQDGLQMPPVLRPLSSGRYQPPVAIK